MKKHVESISNMQSVGYSPSQRFETPEKAENKASNISDSMEDKPDQIIEQESVSD